MSWLTRTFSGLWGYVGVAFGALAVVAGIFYTGRKSGKDTVRADVAKKSAKAARKANEIRESVSGAGDAELNERLRPYKRR